MPMARVLDTSSIWPRAARCCASNSRKNTGEEAAPEGMASSHNNKRLAGPLGIALDAIGGAASYRFVVASHAAEAFLNLAFHLIGSSLDLAARLGRVVLGT